MPKIGLQPYVPNPNIWEGVEESLSRIFWDIIFAGLSKIIHDEMKIEYPQLDFGGLGRARESASDTELSILSRALRNGKVQYSAGKFSGGFNATLSRILLDLGAKYNETEKVYTIADELVPKNIKVSADSYLEKCKSANKKLMKYLKETYLKITQKGTKITPTQLGADVAISKMVKDFDDHTRDAANQLSLTFDIPTKEDIKKMEAEYTRNMELWVKKFSKEQISELRKITEANARQGYRSDKLISEIQSRYDVCESKAKFLARQETALFVSKYSENKYLKANINRYVWRTAGDNDVRPGHRELNGRIFDFKTKAPAKYMSTGKPENAGEDFNCRCVGVPLVETEKTAKIKTGEFLR